MALRALKRRWIKGTSAAVESGMPEARLMRATAPVAEALETRRLLSITPAQLVYQWDHLKPALLHDLAVYEYIDPEFQVRLDAELATYGLAPIQPEAGTLDGLAQEARHKVHLRPHKLPRPRPHHKPHHRVGRDTTLGPKVTDTNFYYNQSLPNEVAFTFDQQAASADWNQALTVIDLNTGLPVPFYVESYTATNTVVYGLNITSPTQTGSPLASGNYVAILDGSKVYAYGNSSLKMLGSDNVAGDEVPFNFFFGAADIDHNGITGLADFGILSQFFGSTSATFGQGDLNYDGRVSLADFSIFANNFGDTTLPLDGPGALTATAVSDAQIQLNWGASADSSTITYDVYRDNVRIAPGVTGTTYTDTLDSSLWSQPHSYFVVAKDDDNASSDVGSIVVSSTAPQVSSNNFSFQTLPQQLTFNFSQPVSASWGSALSLINLKTGSAVTPSASSYTASSPSVTYSFSTPLPDGNYAAILKSSQITGASGAPLAAADNVPGDDYVYNFYVLKGDLALTGERAVGLADYQTAQRNENNAGTYSAGDVNYDGTVDSSDVTFINGAYGSGVTLPLLTPVPGAPTLTAATTGEIDIAWPASTDSNTTSYDIYRDYALIKANQTGTGYNDTGLTPGSSHVYFVVAKSATGQTSYISPELHATATPLAPSTPSTPLDVQATANSVLLAWTDNDPSVTGYDVYRNGVLIPGASNVATSAYYDTGLSANTTYVYTIVARTAAGTTSTTSSSTPVTTLDPSTLPTGYITTPPAAPGTPSVHDASSTGISALSMTWAASSGTGIHYEIDRAGVPVGGTTSTSFTDYDVIAGTSYTYQIIAFDGAGNESAPSAASAAVAPVDDTPPGTPTDLTVTGVTNSSVALSWAPASDDVGVDHYVVTSSSGTTHSPMGTTFSESGLTAGTAYTYSVVAVDAAGNSSPATAPVTAVTTGGTAPTPVDSSPNQYIPPDWLDDFYRASNGLTAVLRQRMAAIPGTPLTPPAAAEWYDTSDTIISGTVPTTGDQTQIHGTPGDYVYVDANGDGKYTSGEIVWYDANHNGIYDTGEVTYPSSSTVAAGTRGRTNGITGATLSGGGVLIWKDSTTFSQDFAAFYTGLDAVLPDYASTSTDAYNPSSERLTVGTALTTAPTITIPNDSLNIVENSGGTFTITDTAHTLGNELVPGDCVLLNGVWYPAQAGSDGTTLNITAPFRYIGTVGSGVPLKVCNWTLVPATTDTPTGATFSYERGIPSAGNLIFQQQFAELHTVLGQLNTLAPIYGIARFDSSSSAAYLTVAREVINAYDSVVVNGRDTTLASAIINKASDPGAVYDESLIADLRSLVHSLAGDIYVRGTGPNSRNGWAVDVNGNPITFNDPSILDILLPDFPNPEDSNIRIRIKDNWSGDSFGNALANGSDIDPEQLAEIEQFVQVMTGQDRVDHPRGASDQALYVAMDTPTLTGSDNGAEIGLGSESTNILNTTPPDQWPNDDAEKLAFLDAPGASASLGHLTFKTESNFANYDLPLHLVAIGDVVNASEDSSVDGKGSTVTEIVLGPNGGIQYLTSSWQAGQSGTLLNVSASQIESLLISLIPTPPSSGSIRNPGTLGTVDPTSPTGLEYDWTATGETTAGVTVDTINVDVQADVKVTSAFGLVPLNNNNFVYAPNPNSPPSTPVIPGSPNWSSVGTMPNPSTDPLPLTTQMDYQNVQPDTNLDGIVNVPMDLQSFGNDTGVMGFQAERLAAQTYLPIFTNADGAIPYSGYIQQGAFADAAADGNLLATDSSAPGNLDLLAGGAAVTGLPYFYSLDTYVRPNVVINDSVNHIKRMEVIRPGGNAVVFDFPWDAATNSFSEFGSPLGWNARDSRRTYVLHDLNPASGGMNYALEFADGTVQTFNTKLVSVSEPNGLTQNIASTLTPTGDTSDSDRYSVAFEFSSGKISAVDYQVDGATGTPPLIHTAIGYSTGNPNLITSLTKTDETTGGNYSMPEFNYTLAGTTITTDLGLAVSRSGPMVTNVNNTSVTITVTPPSGDSSFSSGTSTAETYRFNSDGLVNRDIATLNGSGGLSTSIIRATYTYYTGSRSTVNGYAPWGGVKLYSPAGQPWVGYIYNSTGWVTDQVTPFESDAFSGSTGSNIERQFTYGAGADTSALVQRPTGELDYDQGTFTGGTMYSYDGTTVVSRAMPLATTAWASGVMETTSTVTYNASTKTLTTSTAGLGGSSKSTSTFNSSTKQTSQVITQLWGGNAIALSTELDNAFGGVVNSESQSAGSVDMKDTATDDAIGRDTADTLSGGAQAGATYNNSVTFFGPVSVNETDGSLTKYTYNAMGEVASKIIYSGTNHAVQYSWKYDAAGNIVSVTTTAVDSSGNALSSPLPVTNTYQYDSLGRLIEEIDNAGGTDATANRTTEYFYDDESGVSTEYVTYPDGSDEEIARYVDGSLDSDLGAAVTGSYGSEGVIDVFSAGLDAAGGSDSNVTVGSTWTSITTGGAANTTTTYTNTLGQVYLVQKTQPGSGAHAVQPMADAVSFFDGDGRVYKSIGFDGTTTYTNYDPMTGAVASSFIDMNNNGVYDPGIDQKSVTTVVGSMLPAAGSAAGAQSADYANTGNDDTSDSEQTVDPTTGLPVGYTDESETENGLTTDVKTPTPASGSNGAWVTTTTNPDGTKIVDTYTEGLLTKEETETASGSDIVTPTVYSYDGLRRLISQTDYTGTTAYTYFQDGTQATVTTPGHDPVSVAAVDPTNDAATATTRADSGTVHTPQTSQTRISAQQGAGVLPATYGYDTTGTGQLTSLTTYQGAATFSGTTITGTGAATTTWGYDPASGLLTSKKYADGSTDQYQYNGKFQLANIIEPGITGSSFTYNAAGQQVSSSMTDVLTGKVSSTVTGVDEMGRPLSVADTDNGKTFTTTSTTNANQQPDQVIFGSAGNSSLTYDYYPTSGYGTTGSPQALQSTTLNLPGEQTPVETDYAYDGSSKRLSTITVNGIKFTIGYQTGSNQVSQVQAAEAVSSPPQTITIAYDYDNLTGTTNADPARLREIDVTNNSSHPFTDAVTSTGSAINYNQQDQITGRQTITVEGAGTSTVTTTTQNLTYAYDPTQGDALTGVSGTQYTNVVVTSPYSNNTTTSGISAGYGYDNVGNFTGNSTLGTANNVNQYSNLTYNGRGDVTDDGTYSFGYDAQDRLIRVTPHDTSQLQVEYGYDSQGRRLWKDVYAYSSGAWGLSYSRRYIWDGNNLVAELDGNDTLLTGYTWGPMGLLAVTDYTATGGPKTYVAVQDLSGNVVELMNPYDGTLAALYRYDAYGNPISATGPAAAVNSFRGKGYFVDSEVPTLGGAPNPKGDGSARVLDFPLHIFLQRDPAGEINGSMDLYQAFAGDPINKSDPSGEAAIRVSKEFLKQDIAAKTLYGNKQVQDANGNWVTTRTAETIWDASFDSNIGLNPYVKQISVRAGGVAQASFSTVGAIYTAPVALTGFGSVAFLSNVDNAIAGLRTFATGESTATGTQTAAATIALNQGASVEAANTIGALTNFGVSLGSNWAATFEVPPTGFTIGLPSMGGASVGAPNYRSLSAASDADKIFSTGSPQIFISKEFAAEQAAENTGATFGNAAATDYRATFFAANPELEGQVVVHHAVEQQVLNKFPGVVTESQIHSLENLRGIPYEINSDVHLSQIRIEWNRFYKPFIESGTSPTPGQLLQKATEIDTRFGSQFRPPAGGG